MIHKLIIERLRQGNRTVSYPKSAPVLPPRFRGRPALDADLCLLCRGRECYGPAGRPLCSEACPLDALSFNARGPLLDMGKCSFCGLCAQACPAKAVEFTRDWRLAASRREDLLVAPLPGGSKAPSDQSKLAQPLPERLRSAFSRSFRLRQVSAAGCNACEADINVLGTVVFDLPRFGIDMVASPRHADALLISGPAPRNMSFALLSADRATPDPKLIIAFGVCGISGGLFRDELLAAHGQQGTQSANGVSPHLKVDLYIPGCQPHPYTTLDALLRTLGRKAP